MSPACDLLSGSAYRPRFRRPSSCRGRISWQESRRAELVMAQRLAMPGQAMLDTRGVEPVLGPASQVLGGGQRIAVVGASLTKAWNSHKAHRSSHFPNTPKALHHTDFMHPAPTPTRPSPETLPCISPGRPDRRRACRSAARTGGRRRLPGEPRRPPSRRGAHGTN